MYTDSAYYMDRATAKHLLTFYDKHVPLTCEIDAYGDFLQALGPEATEEVSRRHKRQRWPSVFPPLFNQFNPRSSQIPQYCENTANVIDVESDLTKLRRALFQHLRGIPLNVVLCHVVG